MPLFLREAAGPEVRQVSVWQRILNGEGIHAFGPRHPITAGATDTEAIERGTRLPGQHRGDRLLPVLLGG